MSKYYDDGRFLSAGYTVNEVKFSYSYWDDSVGDCFSKEAEKAPASFNHKNFETWEKIGPLLKVEDNNIQYNSREYEIRGLKVDE